MKKRMILFAALLMHYYSYAQLPDTIAFNKKDFRDSLSIKRLIDTAFSRKDAEPFAALKMVEYACNRAIDLENETLQAGAINAKAGIYSSLEDHETALKLHYEALRIFEKKGYQYGIAMSLNNIGKVYFDAGKLKEAVSYLDKAEQFSLSHHLELPLLLVYENGANTCIGLNRLDKALSYALKADSLNRTLNHPLVKASNNNTLGALYYFRQEYANALGHYQQAKEQALQAGDLPTHYKAIINMGEVYEITHQQDPLVNYTEALKYAQSVKNYPIIQYAATNIANYYQARQNYRLALENVRIAAAAEGKNKSIQGNRHLQLLQIQYETEKKEQEILLLNKENAIHKLSIRGRNKTIGIISALFILSLITGLLLYNRYRFRQKIALQHQALRQREELTKAVIDAEEKERKRIASDLHDGVGQLFSAVKMNLTGLFGRLQMDKEADRFAAEKTMALVDESCKEVRLISHQMMPNMLLRSGIASDVRSFIEKIDSENLEVNFVANGFRNRIESNAETVLYRVIQECVNNVIKHSRASQLDIILDRLENGIEVVIADNGIGFDTAALQRFEGIGLKNVRARIEYLKGTVQYESASGKGTTVRIWVPL